MNIDDWKSQIKRGTLEFCILLMIKQRPSYGYEIILFWPQKRIQFIRYLDG